MKHRVTFQTAIVREGRNVPVTVEALVWPASWPTRTDPGDDADAEITKVTRVEDGSEVVVDALLDEAEVMALVEAAIGAHEAQQAEREST